MDHHVEDAHARRELHHHDERLRSLEAQLSEIQAEWRDHTQRRAKEEREHRKGANLAVLTVLILFSLSVTTALVYRTSFRDEGTSAEFVTYALPALAALIAGLTAFLKDQEIRWFWTSASLVLAGVVVFIREAGVTAQLLWDLGIAYGTTTVICVPLAIGLHAWRKKKRPRLRYILLALVFSLLGAAGVAEAVAYHDRPTKPFVDVVTWAGLNEHGGPAKIKCIRFSVDSVHQTELLKCPRE